MTVPSSTQVAGPFYGNGVSTNFPFTFKCFDKEHLRFVVATDGVEVEKVLDSDYSVTLNGDQDTNPGGSVTYPISGSAMASGSAASIEGSVPMGQGVDLPDGGAFNASDVERALDILGLQNVQQQDQINRSLRLPVTAATADAELPPPDANSVIGWDSAGAALRNFSPETFASVVAYSNRRTLVADGGEATYTLAVDPGNVNNTLVAVGGVVQTPGVDYTISGVVLTPTTVWPAGTGNVVIVYGEALPVGTVNAADVTYTPGGSGAVDSTVQTKLRNIVSVTDFGGHPGAGFDNTVAMQFAEACLAAMGGGVLHIPYPGEWYMNWVCLSDNIHVVGPGGRSEFDVNCIRPYSLSSAAITFGNGSASVRYCSISRCHISGTDKSAGSVLTATGNAPEAVRLTGGTIDFHMDECVVYNGVRNLAAVPTLEGASITGVVISRCHFRNDLAGVTTARNFYLARYEHNVDSPDLGYLTAFTFLSCRVNGPKNTDNSGNPTTAAPTGAGVAGGYVMETATLGNVGMAINVVGESYWDCSAGAGLFLDEGCQVIGEFQLDPGGTNRVIVKNGETSLNPARFIVGRMRHGGQRFENGSGTSIAIPSEADTFAYKPLIQNPFLIGPIYFTNSLDPYDASSTAPYFDEDTAAGPLTINRSDFSVKTPGYGLRVAEGANAKQGVATLVGGTVTVSNTSVTANSRIMLTPQSPGGTPGWVRVSARSAGVSFTITSSSGTDTSVIAYLILEPA